MPTAYHWVHYRRFEADGAVRDGATLESLCRSALAVADSANVTLWERASDRVCESIDGGDRQILLNRVADLNSALFGEMCLMQSGGLQALLALTPSTVKLSNLTTAQVFELSEKTAPAGSQFVRGMAYWLAVGNHVFLVKTHLMTPGHILAYVEWLLKTRTVTLVEGVRLGLRAEFDRSADVGDIRSLRVSGDSAPRMMVAAAPEDLPALEVGTSRQVDEKFVAYAQAESLVRVLFGEARANSLIESLGDREYLAVDAAVKIKGRRTAAAKARLRDIASELADMTDARVQIEGKDGRISDGDAILRTRMPFDLPHDGSTLLEFHNVADQLQEVYKRFVKDGKIGA